MGHVPWSDRSTDSSSKGRAIASGDATEFAPALDPASVCAWEEATAAAGVDTPAVYTWRPATPAAVLGISQDAARELHLSVLEELGIRVLRRASGGGAVLLLPGVLCWGVMAPPEHAGVGGLREAYRTLTEPVRQALRSFGIACDMRGISDLSVEDKGDWVKVAGTAQMRKRGAVLVHGTLLVRADLEHLERCLAFPSQTPDYRAGRSHTAFCRNVCDLVGPACEPCDEQTVAHQVRVASADLGWRWNVPKVEPLPEIAARLLQEKYCTADWNLRRRGRR